MLFAVIGYPVKHSLSPRLHTIAFNFLNIKAYYTKVEVPPERLEEFFKTADITFNGLNITIPHKVKVFEMVDVVDPIAREAGAVNTVLFKDGKSYGYNTDVKGVRMAIEDAIDPKGKSVAIIGAGGAARAAVVAFYKDAKITIFNRTYEKAKKLAEEFGVEARPLSAYEEIAKHDIVINATPVGMDGKSMPIPPEALRKGQVVMDMIYRPLYTPLLKEAMRRGAKAVNGLKMLVIQGIESERIWLGRAPPWKHVYRELIKEL